MYASSSSSGTFTGTDRRDLGDVRSPWPANSCKRRQPWIGEKGHLECDIAVIGGHKIIPGKDFHFSPVYASALPSPARPRQKVLTVSCRPDYVAVASHSRCFRDEQSKGLNLFLVPCRRICADRVVSYPQPCLASFARSMRASELAATH